MSLAVRLLIAAVVFQDARAGAIPEKVLRPTTEGSLGAVASEAVECSAIGRDLLARGVSLTAVVL